MRKEESLKCIKSSFSNVFLNYVPIHKPKLTTAIATPIGPRNLFATAPNAFVIMAILQAEAC